MSPNTQVVMEMSHDLSRWQAIEAEELPSQLRHFLPSENSDLTGWFMNKFMTCDVSKMSAKNHFKMKSSKWLQNVYFRFQQLGIQCVCYIEFITSILSITSLWTFGQECFCTMVWNISRERAKWEIPEAQTFLRLVFLPLPCFF